ncbi:MAG: hypothetical protein WC919_05425 [Candidatus Paceibacterota bacterium]|jgi:hypothetical protein
MESGLYANVDGEHIFIAPMSEVLRGTKEDRHYIALRLFHLVREIAIDMSVEVVEHPHKISLVLIPE